MNLKTWHGLHYSVEADSIRCAADRDGCSVFEVGGLIGTLLILAHDLKEAEETYQREYEDDPRYCPLCESIDCDCE